MLPASARAVLDEVEGLDPALTAGLWEAGRAWAGRPIDAALPSFKTYDSDELAGCGKGSGAFPAFSITGRACALGCAHCGGRILEPLIPAGPPNLFERMVRTMHDRQGLRGLLLSGGSNVRNEVGFERYLPAVTRLKRDMPGFEVAVHTGLVDRRRAQMLAAAGVDVAMLDIIGHQSTVNDVYNLDRPVADFEASLEALVATGLEVVPHIVIGLHFGRLLGEVAALDIIARHRTRSVILIVLMPYLAQKDRFVMPAIADVASVMGEARRRLPDRRLLLGCARPAGAHRVATDCAAVLAGFDGIAHPADAAVRLARAINRLPAASPSCCGVPSCRAAA